MITTASAGNHAYVRSLGADRVIDYNTEDFTQIGPICDVVFDTVGGARCARAPIKFEARRPAGVDRAGARGISVPRRRANTRPDVKRDRAHLERMLALLMPVDRRRITRYKLADAAQAHQISEGRHLRGKLVLEVR